jgi:hypothetical protein
MRDRKMQQRFTLFFGILLSFGMVAGLVLPFITQNLQNLGASAPQATDIPIPTAPAPPETTFIQFDQNYLHSSGLFTVAVPTGWTVSNEFSTASEAQVTMQNPSALSVLEVRVIEPNEAVTLDSVGNLGAQFTQDWLRSSWRQYSTWREDARYVEDEQLVIDFNLSRSGQEFVARQVAYTDGTWIYTIRVVMPSNASEVMQYVLENEIASLQTVERFLGTSLELNSYFDNTNKYMIRFPNTWTITDAADGVPASIAGDSILMRVETVAATMSTEDEASAYVASLRTGTQVLSVEAVEQFGLSGYRVAYVVPTLDGPTESGIALILNGEGGRAHIANIVLPAVQNTDLNTVDLEAEDTAQSIKDLRQALDTFSLFPEIELSSTE